MSSPPVFWRPRLSNWRPPATTDFAGATHLTITLPVHSGAGFSWSPSLAAAMDGVVCTIDGSSDLVIFSALMGETTPALSAGLPVLKPGWECRSFRLAADTTLPTGVFVRAGIGRIAP